MYYYEVAPTKIIRQESITFTYASETILEVGTLVIIPVGKKTYVGVTIKQVSRPSYDTKLITNVLRYPPLPQPLLRTALWISDYYGSHLANTLQTLLPTGITKSRRLSQTPSLKHHRERTHFLLNKSQQDAIAQVVSSDPGTFILHGITASGKTAVYIELVRQMIQSGKSAIVLVPEIALTSQLVAEFRNHFDSVLIAHSHQTEAERHRTWEHALTSTEPIVAIGARSALFLPLTDVGLIIIDEAHEPSYKQDKTPRYSALRAASVLSKHHGAKLIQGSATPLVTEYYLAKNAARPIIELREKARHDALPPEAVVVDMTQKSGFKKHRFISDKLISTLTESLEKNEQCLIYHNRRGSASMTLCEACGWSAICPRCFVPMTLHADKHLLECHICGNKDTVPTSCPECASTDIIHKGIGTKLLEAELKKLFPDKVIARFDGDAASDATLEKRYQELYDGSIDIIIGTQVVAKGLDLPHLRTVGVVQADAGLSLPDYQSSERTFQLLSQVVGRVGRSSHPTTVIVQTYQPEHPAIKYGIAQDYHAFYDYTVAERNRATFPPFTYLLKLTCIYKTEATTVKNSMAMAKKLRETHPDVLVLGPTPAFYERQRDTYRWQLIIKSTDRDKLLTIMRETISPHWQADIDPGSLL
jgi:primosomal protein N' (replication factor Y)